MEEPGYRARSKAELRGALAWGQGKLFLKDWTFTLAVDAERGRGLPSGRMDLWPARLMGAIYISRPACKREDIDPAATIFHEIAHVLTDPMSYAGEGQMVQDAEELMANRIEWLLYELWTKELSPKGG